MIKRTLLFEKAAYLSTRKNQLVVSYPGVEEKKTVAIEDIGFIILEDPQITLSNKLLEKLILNNAAVISCNEQHLPISYLLPLTGHSEQNERIRFQLEASLPLKKNLWQQTIQAKIRNQAALLDERSVLSDPLWKWAKEVNSGDSLNHEAQAAAYYWQNLFDFDHFNRHRSGLPPNNVLNYGYAILRALCARSLVGSGLLPVMGIHHANKYNPFCLADDIMEPYRPYVDMIVCQLVDKDISLEELTTELKKELLMIPTIDVVMEGKKSPLLIAMSRTSNSLFECFTGMRRKLLYPEYGVG